MSRQNLGQIKKAEKLKSVHGSSGCLQRGVMGQESHHVVGHCSHSVAISFFYTTNNNHTTKGQSRKTTIGLSERRKADIQFAFVPEVPPSVSIQTVAIMSTHASRNSISILSKIKAWVHSPTGPKTTHFWGPVANWGFVVAVGGFVVLSSYHVSVDECEWTMVHMITSMWNRNDVIWSRIEWSCWRAQHVSYGRQDMHVQGLADSSKPAEMISPNMTAGVCLMLDMFDRNPINVFQIHRVPPSSAPLSKEEHEHSSTLNTSNTTQICMYVQPCVCIAYCS